MKKISLSLIATFTLLSLVGCQQIQENTEKLKQQSTETIKSASQQFESAKTQASQAKNQLDEKTKQAQTALDAVKKLGE
jgi:cell division protein ZapA (FtsZ GTPase activity inhibitor)